MTAVFMFDDYYKTWKYINLQVQCQQFVVYFLSKDIGKTTQKVEKFMRRQSNYILSQEEAQELHHSMSQIEENKEESKKDAKDDAKFWERRYKKNDRPWLVFGRVV